MCEYQENIDAAAKWKPGDVLRHYNGELFTITKDYKFFSHQTNSVIDIVSVTVDDYWKSSRSYFTLLT